MKTTYYIFFLLFLSGVMLGQDELTYNFSGFADTYHAVRSKEPYDFMSSRSRLRTEFEVSRGRSFLFASLNSVYNSLLTEETGIELREAYLQYTTNHWDFKAGRQIVIWGVADGLRITDIVSPMDMSEFLAREYDDIRIPVNAFKLKCFNSKVSAEAIFIPVSSFFIISTSGNNPWSILPTAEGLYYEADLEDYPEKTLDNSEVGARMSFYLPGIDFSISALHTWNKMPVLGYEYSSNNDTAFVYGQYDRMDMLGADLSVPFGEFVFRGEVAEYFGELQETIVATENIKRNTTNFLVGIDWYPGGDWTVTAQYSHKLIPGHVDVLANKANTAFTTLGITKKVIRSTLNLSTFTYFDIANRGLFNRTSADYSLTDQIRLMAGYDWFHGDKGMFSLYGDNSEFWIKAKFGF